MPSPTAYVITLPKGASITIELASRPVDLTLTLPDDGGTVKFSRAPGSFPAVKGKIDFSLNASKVDHNYNTTSSPKKHTLTLQSGDTFEFSDPEM